VSGTNDPVRVPAAVAEARQAARRAADAWQSSRLGMALAGAGVAAFLMGAFIVLDYTFDQDPHRILKVALGLLAILAIMTRPKTGLLILPVVTPFLPWIPPTPLPGLNALNVLLFAVFGTFALGKVLRRERLFRPNHLGALIGWLLLLCAVSIVRGAAFPTGYGFEAYPAAIVLFRSATTFSLYFIVLAMVDGEGDRRRVLWAVLLGLLLESVATILYGRSGPGGRAIGSIGQSNELGSFVALLSVVAFAMVPAVRSWIGKLMLLGTMFAGSLALIYSLSRGAMVAFLVSLFYVAWRSSKTLFGVLLLTLALSPVWAPDYLKARITSSQVEVEGSDQVTLDKASEARIETWQSLLLVVKAHPIDGVGFTGLGYVLPDIGNALGLADVKDSAHNTYLRMLAEMGVLGLVLFLWLMARCLWLAEKGIRAARTRFDRGLAVGMGGAAISMLIGCAFGDRFWNVLIASGFWVICALVDDFLLPLRRNA